MRGSDREKKAPACCAEAGEYSGYVDDIGVVDISVNLVFRAQKNRQLGKKAVFGGDLYIVIKSLHDCDRLSSGLTVRL